MTTQAKGQRLFLILAFIIPAAVSTKSAIQLDAGLQQPDSTPFFEDAWYLAIYVFFWCLIFEISVIIVVHFKHHPTYVSEHTFLNFMAIAGQFANNFFFLRRWGYPFQAPFMIRELIILGLLGAQAALGYLLNKKLESEALVRGIFIYRFLHKSLGRAIYLCVKLQIAIFCLAYFKDEPMHAYLMIGMFLGILAITHFGLFFLLNMGDLAEATSAQYLVNTSPRSQEYYDLLRCIDSGEITRAPSPTWNQELSVVHSTQLEEKQIPIDWVIICNRVFDITGLRHPKGNYILKAVRFQDITREVLGLKSWRFAANGCVKYSRHKHSPKTFNFLREVCIGELGVSDAIMGTMRGQAASLSATSSNLNLFRSELGKEASAEGPSRSKNWEAAYTHQLVGQDSILFLSKTDKDFVANLSSYWLKNFGKYFLLKNSKNEKNYFFVTFAISTKYLAARREWYQKLSLSIVSTVQALSGFDVQELIEVNSTLQNRSKSLSGKLERQEDVKDSLVPLYIGPQIQGAAFFADSDKFTLEGPLGLGIGFDSHSTKKILIMISDDGVLPFTDFFEYIGQRALIELNGNKQPHPIFTKEYLLQYINDVELWVYWEISEAFAETARLLGLASLETFNLAFKEGGRWLGNDPSKIINVVKRINIISNKPFKQDGKIFATNDAGKNYRNVKELALSGDGDGINKVIVSGNNAFSARVLSGVELESHQIILL